jgi:hypothetical protein
VLAVAERLELLTGDVSVSISAPLAFGINRFSGPSVLSPS